jgi:hypothetical protein
MSVIASVNPAEVVAGPGTTVRINASSSYATDGSELTYVWAFTTLPLGSRLSDEDLRSADVDNSVVTFVPDSIGTYEVRVTASAGAEAETADARVMSQYAIAYIDEPTTPNADYFYDLVGDFWDAVANSEMLSTLWSGYTQIVGSDIARLYQLDTNKSLATIKSAYERRWLPYHPLLDLSGTNFTAVFGEVQVGAAARTEVATQSADAVLISAREILLVSETAGDRAVGQTLTVTSGPNAGAYTVSRVNSDGSGYVVSTSTPFPAYDSEVVLSGADLYGLRGSTTLTSAASDLAAGGAIPGQVLKLVAGADSGYYTIVAVGLAGGLLSDRQIQVDRPIGRNRSGMSFSVLTVRTATVDFVAEAYSSLVYLPDTEADLSVYTSSPLRGTATIASSYEVLVQSRHIYDALIGRAFKFLSGPDAGRSFIVSGVNSARTGYYLSSAVTTSIGGTASYELGEPYTIASRLICVGGVTAPILSATKVGSDWVVSVPANIVPAGITSASWAIGHAVEVDGVDLVTEGVSAGDLLVAKVSETRTGYSTELPLVVLGSYKNYALFGTGSAAPNYATGTPPALSDKEVYTFFSDLTVPGVSYVDGVLTLSRTAASIATAVQSLAFQTTNWNIPVSDETVITVSDASAAAVGPLLTLSVGLVGIVRNSKIKVEDSLLSLPALFEYLREPRVTQTGTSEYTFVAQDGTVTLSDKNRVTLLQNDQFTIISDFATEGLDAATTTGSEEVTLPALELAYLLVAPGDTLELLSGRDMGSYVIVELSGPHSVRVRPTTQSRGILNTSTSVSYRIKRQQSTNFICFVPGTFTATAPAPRYLWAELSIFDNYEAIENNFGLVTGISKQELDAYGSSQDSYLTVVRGLAFARTNSPTFDNLQTAAHLILGLPVSAHDGVVIEVDETFSEKFGRVTVQDLDAAGDPQTTNRSYLYRREDYASFGFGGIALNPLTGISLQEGDVVLELQPLGRGAAVEDYVQNPKWWTTYGTLRGRELEKFHTWSVSADLLQLPAEDLALVSGFLDSARPIYTKPTIIGVLGLVDEVAVEDDISFEGTLLLFDDPAFSVESTHMVDDYDESSVSLRTLDVGSFGTRVLFRGRDLATAGGAGTGFLTVTSARGGFVDPMTAAVNSYFPAIQTRGDGMIKAADGISGFPGDVLRILTGPNAGMYEVTSVVSDTELIVRQFGVDYFSSTGVVGPDPDETSAAVDQEFAVQRLNGPIVAYGTGTVTTGSASLTDVEGNFITNNATVGDVVVVISSSGDATEHTVLDVVRTTMGTQDSVELVLDEEFAADDDVEYYVYRETLLQNPIFSAEVDLDGTATIVTAGHAGSFLRAGDVVQIMDGSEVTDSFVVAGLPNLTDILILPHYSSLSSIPVFPIVGTGVSLRVIRPSLDSAEDSDSALETLWVGEETTFDVMNPVTFLALPGAVIDGVVDVATSTVTSATDLEAAGATAGMKVQFASALNTGVYVIESVSTTTLTLTTPPSADESGVSLSIVTAAAEFLVDASGEVVTVSPYNFLGDITAYPYVANLLPGDIFEYEGNQVMISEVFATSFFLCQVPPPATAALYTTGRIFRTRRT